MVDPDIGTVGLARWWLGRHVEYRNAGGAWVLGEVVIVAAANRGTPVVDGGDRQLPFEAAPGAPDSTLEIALLEGRRRVVVSAEVFTGGAHGIAPDVVLAAPIEPEVLGWWRRLPVLCRVALLADPGRVPAECADSVRDAKYRPGTGGSDWSPAEHGSDGYLLRTIYRNHVVDMRLRADFIHAQTRLDRVQNRSIGNEGAGPPDPVGSARWCLSERDAAKTAWDVHRIHLSEAHRIVPPTVHRPTYRTLARVPTRRRRVDRPAPAADRASAGDPAHRRTD